MNYGELKAKIDTKLLAQCTVPVADGGNTGDGTMSTPVVKDAAVAELWTVTCSVEGADDTAKFTVTGGVSGLQNNLVTSGNVYTTDDGLVSFLIEDGAEPWDVADEFTFTVSEDGDGLTDATEFRDINFVIHSKVDDVKVGYDAGKNQVCVIQID